MAFNRGGSCIPNGKSGNGWSSYQRLSAYDVSAGTKHPGMDHRKLSGTEGHVTGELES